MNNWKLTWGDRSWTSDDLTVAQFALAQVITGDGWNSANPLQGPQHAANLLAILLAAAEARDLDDVLGELGALPASQIVNAVGPA